MLQFMLFGKRLIDRTDSYELYEVMGYGMSKPVLITEYYPKERARLVDEQESIN